MADRTAAGGAVRRARRGPALAVLRAAQGRVHWRERWKAMCAAAAGELSAGRDVLWYPVAAALGIALYFGWPGEPSGVEVGLLFAAGALVFAAGRFSAGAALRLATLLVLLAAGGFAHAKISTERHRAPRVEAPRTATVLGHVERLESRDSGWRLTIRTVAVSGYAAELRPRRLQVALRGAASPPEPGSPVSLRVRLQPPSPPLVPGGYDFARRAFFAEIAGTGFAIGPVAHWQPAPEPSAGLHAVAALERFRQRVARHIRETVPGDPGAIAAALMVGDRGAITPEADEAMRIAGLSHVLSISGLHMTLVTAAIYGVVRALLAALPFAALRWPVKQVAAAVGLVGGLGYLAVSGLGIPTQRAAVMTSLVLLAVILGRPAISLRLVAIAALVVMLLSPEAVLDPGAQMSFAAVAALVGFYEWWSARRRQRDRDADPSALARGAATAGRWVAGLAATSLVAGLATTPIALHHFGRLAPLSLVANLLAAPVVSLVVMPAGLAAAVAMPAGLDGWFLAAMGEGIAAMLAIADLVAGWTPAAGVMRPPPLAATLASVAGGLWLVLWTTPVRRLGLVPLAAGLVGAALPREPPPDLVVSGSGIRVLVRGTDGTLYLLGRGGGFEAELMLRAFGDPRGANDRSLTRATACDSAACILLSPPGTAEPPPAVAIVRRPDAFAEECRRNAVVISPLDAPRWCAETATVIDRAVLAENGATAWRAGENGPELVGRARPDVPRPWSAPGG